ncbi:Clampless protein 1 [Mycena indigotica]|uniref:Clampless protein 1 n=1 Tax=Mycena indigotica TaxID=2126181 RepID=A0A8H6T3C6_9AGAR|nr:Clampless protein 1 [Mycena indigotica]KAF7310296.1 Clampless protein 1 [Mycena indigotica]
MLAHPLPLPLVTDRHATSFTMSHLRPSSSSSATTTTTPALQLPRTLARPAFDVISRAALAAAAPELWAEDVPDAFIRHALGAQAPTMRAGIALLAGLPQALPLAGLPARVTVPIRPVDVDGVEVALPTHTLAVSEAGKGSDGSASVFPIHSVLLAAHCTKLAPLPAPSPDSESDTVALPLLPLPLPSVPAFAIVHHWLYNPRLDAVLAALLPGLPAAFLTRLADADPLPALEAALADRPTLHVLAAHLCAASNSSPAALLRRAAHVRALWQTLVALGICDAGLWAALDVAWEVMLGALNIALVQ